MASRPINEFSRDLGIDCCGRIVVGFEAGLVQSDETLGDCDEIRRAVGEQRDDAAGKSRSGRSPHDPLRDRADVCVAVPAAHRVALCLVSGARADCAADGIADQFVEQSVVRR